MLTKRIIPCLDIKDGRVVKGTCFTDLVDSGDPVELAKRYGEMGADELVFLDITATVDKRKTLVELVSKVGKVLSIPFTVGGGVSELQDVKALLAAGADKVSIGSEAVKNPDFIEEICSELGRQAIVISLDVKKDGITWKVCIDGGRIQTGIDALPFAELMEKKGAGELLVNSLDRDGTKSGYDVELLAEISERVNIPVIASSGAGCKQDFLDAFEKGKVDAVLAARLFHTRELSINDVKNFLNLSDIPIRL